MLSFVNSEAGKELRQWINYKLGSPNASDPTGQGQPNPPAIMTLPSCQGVIYSTCAQRYRDGGLSGAIDHLVVGFGDADLDKRPDEVLQQFPAAGSDVDRTGGVAIESNPPASDMPVRVPGLADEETFQTYAARLHNLGLTGVRDDLEGVDYRYLPDQALETDPSETTRVAPASQVTVKTNPRDVADDEPGDRCEVGTKESPDPNTSEDPYGVVQTFTARDPREDGAQSVQLRYGVASRNWGYRHIAEKHGWDGPVGMNAKLTQLALQDAAPVPQRPASADPSSFRYYAFYIQRLTGAKCTRRVVVEYKVASNAPGEVEPKHIITSFSYEGWIRR